MQLKIKRTSKKQARKVKSDWAVLFGICIGAILVYSLSSLGCYSRQGERPTFTSNPLEKSMISDNSFSSKPESSEDILFELVEFDSTESFPCSPTMPSDPNWHGIIIRAPERILISVSEPHGRKLSLARIPICGFFNVSASPSADLSEGKMRLIATDTKTGKAFFGDVVAEDDGYTTVPPPEEPPTLQPEELEGLSVGGYFNYNLAKFVSLPASQAEYDIYLDCGNDRSNTVRMRVLEQEDNQIEKSK